MKIKSGFIVRKVADEYFAVPIGDMSKESNCMIRLNATGVYIWNQLQKESTFEEVLQKILTEYDIDKEDAITDLDNMINYLEENHLIEH